MALNDVKEITVPVNGTNKAVKKIEDSNGNIIWGSQSAFPYRRLEYIESTGTQAIDTGIRPQRNSYMILKVEDTSNGASSQQQGRGAVSQNQRFASGFNNGNYFFGLGGSWFTGNAASSGPHVIGCQGPECNVINLKEGTTTKGAATTEEYGVSFVSRNPTYPASTITWYSVYLFGSRGNTSGSIQGPVSCKLYYAELGYTNASNNNRKGYNRRMFPVQRKSDGKLGMYDVQNNLFLYELVSGSDANSLVAGPVADEYWDMTYVSVI